ncbi:MAG: phosphate ABC transporter ATP-binding protein [Streptosporangiales bacterium]|nr:phosphate ABC transporter ATP-binding protein [Streptosporangiales bacterium]
MGFVVNDLTASFGSHVAVEGLSMGIEPNRVTALIGPSGCGKSTFLRCLNGMHLNVSGATVRGQVLLDNQDVYAAPMDLVGLRQRVGMVFQRPNPFPTMSIYDNVVAGVTLGHLRRARRDRRAFDDLVEQSLTAAGLWREVKDRLPKPGASLSGGQQQRLCIARTLAIEPEVILMDEPCSALDPISTLAIEDTIGQLKKRFTIVIVTHNMQQASRVSDTTAFMTIREAGQPGRLIEVGPTKDIFQGPKEQATDDYISGRVG